MSDINTGEVMESLNSKMDTDGKNIAGGGVNNLLTQDPQGFMSVMEAIRPDWSRKETLPTNTDNTITKYGWFFFDNQNYTWNAIIYVNGEQLFHLVGSSGRWEDNAGAMGFLGPGDVIKATAGKLLFLPCKGN